ncbi:MAG: T9SS type A sorting domain-containing protein [Candidatus Edwardsbacteria bacterium]|nr:T9SS type A sorting domain-containing protein [Candidatus Edwardsbacteria bacterium]MBU1576396.1 T9SS type A sorting domain-containing protein [Candidatus Edwardsbacteria bacterium]MBU2464031.1 T9SS type A sorting domain-containing protein [Candidatus Edwardsbacteria bacterium]MBU2593573.1 T9SS type A sorting domain-containing protein [Candidatus Edwardsbacteria bacterium]
MSKKMSIWLMTAVVCCLAAATAMAQAKFVEFPVAVGRDSTFSACAIWGGSSGTGIVAILGDTLDQNNITVQFIYPPDSLIGDRISFGRQGAFPGPLGAFDEINYLLVWKEFNGDVNGQFISPSGTLVGSYFTIGSNVSLKQSSLYGLAFSDSTYLVVFVKADTLLYGQMVGKNGVLLGGQVQISSNLAREVSLAYDGTNYLAAWCDDGNGRDIYGQFVSPSGVLVGTNFLIDGGPYRSDNPVSLAFDGLRYLVAFHDQANNIDSTGWNLFGRFVTVSGIVQEKITICDSTKAPIMPSVAFDGDHYLATWTQLVDLTLMGQFWTPAGVPIDAPFIIFNTVVGRIPFGGSGFGGGWFLVVGSRMDSSFTDGDVYGAFIPKYTGVEGKPGSDKLTVESLQLRVTGNAIKYQIPQSGIANLKIYNLLGQEVRTLVNEFKSSGVYSLQWNGCDASNHRVSSGVYLIRLESEGRGATAKMVVVR